jgi:hypothetical protein
MAFLKLVFSILSTSKKNGIPENFKIGMNSIWKFNPNQNFRRYYDFKLLLVLLHLLQALPEPKRANKDAFLIEIFPVISGFNTFLNSSSSSLKAAIPR